MQFLTNWIIWKLAYLKNINVQLTKEQFPNIASSVGKPSFLSLLRYTRLISCLRLLINKRSATAVLFHRPCCFNATKPMPFSLSRVAEFRRKECPEYSAIFGRLRNVAIYFGSDPTVFTPSGCLLSLPDLVADLK